MDQQELRNILELHRKWVMGEDGGKRADLSGADLRSVNLSSASLHRAILSRADLSGADLSAANLSGASLHRADLSRANLHRAILYGADLSRADLYDADLSRANLHIADIHRADLSRANLKTIIEDFHKRLSLAKGEVVGLYDALRKGKINGSCYEGDCACFCGTIANIRGEAYNDMKIDLRPDADSPTERWFLAIRQGETPESNQVSKITCEWIEAWCLKEGISLPKYKLISSTEFPEAFKE